MGAVTFSIDLRVVEDLKKYLPLNIFVETGTYEGDTIEAVQSHFEACFSVELSEIAANKARERLGKFPHVRIENESSPDFLRNLRPVLAEKSVLYWLDAHWCEGNFTSGKLSQCPLLEEIQAIGKLNSTSVVMIDDARLFLAPPLAPHEVSQWPAFHKILQHLQGLSDEHEIMVLNDVIFFYPTAISASFCQFAQKNGTDWLKVSHSARQEPELRRTISELKKRHEALLAGNAVHGAEKLKKEALAQQLRIAKEEVKRLKNQLSGRKKWWKRLFKS